MDELQESVDPLTLPAEITTQIFFHTCQLTITYDGRWKRDFDPLLFGQVSRLWRMFAWSTPELWSSLDITLRAGDEQSERLNRILTLVQQWLARAKVHELDIFVDTMDMVVAPLPIIHEFSSHRMQWRTLNLRTRTAWYPLFGNGFEQADKQPSSFPRLRSFSLMEYEMPSTPPSIDILDLRNAPLLHELIIGSGITIERKLRLPLKQITLFSVLPGRKIDLNSNLTSFPNLVEARFSNLFPISGIYHSPCFHFNLRSVLVSFLDERSLARLLMALTLPRLEHLEVDLLHMSSQTSMQVIYPFLRRSEKRIKRMSLNYAMKEGSEDDIIALLGKLPALKEFSLYVKPVRKAMRTRGLTHRFFDFLDHFSYPSYLPSLETLTFDGPLSVESVELFLEPLIMRASITGVLKQSVDSDNENHRTQLRQLKIRDDHYGETTLSCLHLDPALLDSLKNLLRLRVFELTNRDGSDWFSQEI